EQSFDIPEIEGHSLLSLISSLTSLVMTWMAHLHAEKKREEREKEMEQWMNDARRDPISSNTQTPSVNHPNGDEMESTQMQQTDTKDLSTSNITNNNKHTFSEVPKNRLLDQIPLSPSSTTFSLSSSDRGLQGDSSSSIRKKVLSSHHGVGAGSDYDHHIAQPPSVPSPSSLFRPSSLSSASLSSLAALPPPSSPGAPSSSSPSSSSVLSSTTEGRKHIVQPHNPLSSLWSISTLSGRFLQERQRNERMKQERSKFAKEKEDERKVWIRVVHEMERDLCELRKKWQLSERGKEREREEKNAEIARYERKVWIRVVHEMERELCELRKKWQLSERGKEREREEKNAEIARCAEKDKQLAELKDQLAYRDSEIDRLRDIISHHQTSRKSSNYDTNSEAKDGSKSPIDDGSAPAHKLEDRYRHTGKEGKKGESTESRGKHDARNGHSMDPMVKSSTTCTSYDLHLDGEDDDDTKTIEESDDSINAGSGRVSNEKLDIPKSRHSANMKPSEKDMIVSELKEFARVLQITCVHKGPRGQIIRDRGIAILPGEDLVRDAEEYAAFIKLQNYRKKLSQTSATHYDSQGRRRSVSARGVPSSRTTKNPYKPSSWMLPNVTTTSLPAASSPSLSSTLSSSKNSRSCSQEVIYSDDNIPSEEEALGNVHERDTLGITNSMRSSSNSRSCSQEVIYSDDNIPSEEEALGNVHERDTLGITNSMRSSSVTRKGRAASIKRGFNSHNCGSLSSLIHPISSNSLPPSVHSLSFMLSLITSFLSSLRSTLATSETRLRRFASLSAGILGEGAKVCEDVVMMVAKEWERKGRDDWLECDETEVAPKNIESSNPSKASFIGESSPSARLNRSARSASTPPPTAGYSTKQDGHQSDKLTKKSSGVGLSISQLRRKKEKMVGFASLERFVRPLTSAGAQLHGLMESLMECLGDLGGISTSAYDSTSLSRGTVTSIDNGIRKDQDHRPSSSVSPSLPRGVKSSALILSPSSKSFSSVLCLLSQCQSIIQNLSLEEQWRSCKFSRCATGVLSQCDIWSQRESNEYQEQEKLYEVKCDQLKRSLEELERIEEEKHSRVETLQRLRGNARTAAAVIEKLKAAYNKVMKENKKLNSKLNRRMGVRK
ncbi:hypothetical protein ADUPG1_009995, partial [Aduncisulcus paluster]